MNPFKFEKAANPSAPFEYSVVLEQEEGYGKDKSTTVHSLVCAEGENAPETVLDSHQVVKVDAGASDSPNILSYLSINTSVHDKQGTTQQDSQVYPVVARVSFSNKSGDIAEALLLDLRALPTSPKPKKNESLIGPFTYDPTVGLEDGRQDKKYAAHFAAVNLQDINKASTRSWGSIANGKVTAISMDPNKPTVLRGRDSAGNLEVGNYHGWLSGFGIKVCADAQGTILLEPYGEVQSNTRVYTAAPPRDDTYTPRYLHFRDLKREKPKHAFTYAAELTEKSYVGTNRVETAHAVSFTERSDTQHTDYKGPETAYIDTGAQFGANSLGRLRFENIALSVVARLEFGDAADSKSALLIDLRDVGIKQGVQSYKFGPYKYQPGISLSNGRYGSTYPAQFALVNLSGISEDAENSLGMLLNTESIIPIAMNPKKPTYVSSGGVLERGKLKAGTNSESNPHLFQIYDEVSICSDAGGTIRITASEGMEDGVRLYTAVQVRDRGDGSDFLRFAEEQPAKPQPKSHDSYESLFNGLFGSQADLFADLFGVPRQQSARQQPEAQRTNPVDPDRAAVLREVADLRAQGLPDNRIKKMLTNRYHTDRQDGGSKARMNVISDIFHIKQEPRNN